MHYATSVSKCLHPCLFNYTSVALFVTLGLFFSCLCSCLDLRIPLGLLIIFILGCRMTDGKDGVSSSTVSQLQHPVFIAKPSEMSLHYKMVMVFHLNWRSNSHSKRIAFDIKCILLKTFWSFQSYVHIMVRFLSFQFQ